jgi:enoyl-CoA hydratase
LTRERKKEPMTETADADLVLYEQRGDIAILTLNRPEVRNAQNSALLYALDTQMRRAVEEESVGAIVLNAAGDHFSAGHDIGPTRDANRSFPRVGLSPDHVGKPDAEQRILRETEVYLGLCWRWREVSKPTIAMVQGGCIGGGLMLAWACDLIVASEDAYFADPVVIAGAPAVEWFAHPWQVGPRVAKEMLLLGEPMTARRAEAVGMVNRVVPREQLESVVVDMAHRMAGRPRVPMMLAKRIVNNAEDLMGLRAGVESSFGYHLLSQVHSTQMSGRAVLVERPDRIERPSEETGP